MRDLIDQAYNGNEVRQMVHRIRCLRASWSSLVALPIAFELYELIYPGNVQLMGVDYRGFKAGQYKAHTFMTWSQVAKVVGAGTDGARKLEYRFRKRMDTQAEVYVNQFNNILYRLQHEDLSPRSNGASAPDSRRVSPTPST